MRLKKRTFFASVLAAFCMAVAVPSAVSAQPDVGTLDAQVSDWWSNMYLSGYPTRWYASAWNSIPAHVNYYTGHFQITGPNGHNFNSPDRYNPQASTSGTGAGWVCSTLWVKEFPWSGYAQWGRACAQVY